MENDKLKKIDDIIKRTNTDYSTAKQALDDANGDVLEAIISIETKNKKTIKNTNIYNKGDQIFEQIKNIISKGNATKLTIKKNNETIINIPITAGIVGTIVAPFLSAAGITAALLSQCSVEITQSDGNVININQKVDDVMQDVKQGAQNIKQTAKDFAEDISEEAQDVKQSFGQNTHSFANSVSENFNDIKEKADNYKDKDTYQ